MTSPEKPSAEQTSVCCDLGNSSLRLAVDSPKKKFSLRCSFVGILTLLLIASVVTSGGNSPTSQMVLDLLQTIVQVSESSRQK